MNTHIFLNFGTFIEGIGLAFSYPTFIWIIIGVFVGIVVGATPGIGPGLGMALIIPLTLIMEPINAIILLVGVYSGGMYGGAIAAVLINTPGTAGAAASTFEGYPMSRKGKALDALSISAVSSSAAGFIGVSTLILISPVIVTVVLAFQSPDYFLMALIGLSMITIVSQGAMVKGIMAGMFGLLLTTIGTTPIAPTSRYTFEDYLGFLLFDGIDFIAVLIGLFAISEMFNLASEKGSISKETGEISGNIWDGVKTPFKYPIQFLKSTYIGMGVGALPGAGSSIATFIAYSEAVRSSNEPDSFGKGNEIGLMATEACNNGTIGGALIPTLTFGIPGGGSTAVLLGGLIMHGLRPGPDLFSQNLHITYSIFIALLVGNIVILIFGLLFASRANIITRINTDYIIPIIIVLSFIGGFALRDGNWVDVATVLFLGIIGYFMVKYNYSIIAFVLGVVLGPIAETNLDRSLQISDQSLLIFISEPLTLLLTVILLLLLIGPIFSERIN